MPLLDAAGAAPDGALALCIADLNVRLRDAGVRTMLLLGGADSPVVAGAEGSVETASLAGDAVPGNRYDAIVIAGGMQDMVADDGRRLIAAARDVYARHLFVVVTVAAGAEDRNAERGGAELRALGLRHLRNYADADGAWNVYGFSLSDYKVTPEWLNSRYWANPERFGKYRW